MKIFHLLPLIVALALCLNGVTARGAELAVAPAPEGAPLSAERYAVRLRSAGGAWQSAPVYCFFQQHTYNRAPTTEPHLVVFESTGEIEVEVQVKGEAKSPVLRPLSRAVAVRQEGATLRFMMTDRTRQLCLELNGDPHHPLVLFSNPPETNVPKADDKRVTYFGPGYHRVKTIERPGYFEWAKGTTIYLAPGAVVESSIGIVRNAGVTIRGRGILFTPHGDGKSRGTVPLTISESTDVRVEGIVVVNRADQWSVHARTSRRVTFENFHLLSELRDGLDVLNSQEVTVRDSFIMAHDDAVALKGMWFGQKQPVEKITVERCILANMGGGNGLEIGFEGNTVHFQQAVFRDIDLLYSLPSGEKPDPGWPEGALTVHIHRTDGSTAAPVRDILWEDIRVEELQDDFLIDVRPLGASEGSLMEGLTFRNVRQIGGVRRPSRIEGRSDFPIRNVRIENLQILGKPVTKAEEGDISINEHASGVTFSAGAGK